MSTQQSARDRLKDYWRSPRTDIYGRRNGTVTVDGFPPYEIEEAFLAGEESGKRIAMDEMSAKIAELEAENKRLRDGAPVEWHLDSKEVGEKLEKVDSVIFDLEAQNKQLKDFWKPIVEKFEEKFPNAGNANTLALTALSEAFDIHCKNETIEAQNKKLGDVVLEMAEVLRLIEMRREGFEEDLVECPKLASEELENHADLINTLRQERV